MSLRLIRPEPSDADALTAMVARFHAEEGVSQNDADRRAAVATLLANPAFGAFRLIEFEGVVAGYLAFALGFSIEFNGRDAFLDEIYVEPSARGRGAGGAAVEACLAELRAAGVKAVHLEVAETNDDALRLYERRGFALRRGYRLMSARLDLKQ